MQLKEAEKRLNDSQSKLARLRGQKNAVPYKNKMDNGSKSVKVERRSTSPIHKNEGSTSKAQSKPELVIPAVTPKISQPMKWAGSGSQAGPLVPSHSNSSMKAKGELPSRTISEREVVESQDKGTKRKFGKTLTYSTVSHYQPVFLTMHHLIYMFATSICCTFIHFHICIVLFFVIGSFLLYTRTERAQGISTIGT